MIIETIKNFNCSLDGSDEPPNCPKETCQTKHFTCEESKKCIPLE